MRLIALILLLASCGPPLAPVPERCRDDKLELIKAQCIALEKTLGCAPPEHDPEKLCPEVVEECDARISAWLECAP